MLPQFYTYLLPLEKITTFSTAKVKHRYWVVIYLSLSNLLKAVVYKVAFDPVIEISHIKYTALCPFYDPLVLEVIIMVSNNRTCKNISFSIWMYNLYLLPKNTENKYKRKYIIIIKWINNKKTHLSFSVIPGEKLLHNILLIIQKKYLPRPSFSLWLSSYFACFGLCILSP